MNLGFGEIVLILVIVLIVFGAAKLPELGRSLGLGIKEFKKAASNEETAGKTPVKKTSKKTKKKK